ncbi:MAG: Tim44-like domain-containing protein [Pseudomonadota bacterium]|nr:Tim44-like domain-containing protein [Pseudomonadota bacterium]
MKKFLIGMTLAVAALSMVGESIARPMGGGRSIGRQSSSVSQMRSPAPAPSQQMNRPGAPANNPSAAPATPAKQPGRFGGMLGGAIGGALLGFGLASMFSHFGMGSGMASAMGTILPVILLGLAAFFLYRMFRRRNEPASAPFQGFNQGFNLNPVPAGGAPEIGSGINQGYQAPSPAPEPAAPVPHTPWGVPANFDNDSFLRTAKSSFIRLQAAWDKGDVADLNQFTTPEVFAELKMQIQERGPQRDFTDVVSIEAQLLGIETVNNEYLASVQFNGMIKPAPDALAEPFAEVWNMSKPTNGTAGWVLAGIQQLP